MTQRPIDNALGSSLMSMSVWGKQQGQHLQVEEESGKKNSSRLLTTMSPRVGTGKEGKEGKDGKEGKLKNLKDSNQGKDGKDGKEAKLKNLKDSKDGKDGKDGKEANKEKSSKEKKRSDQSGETVTVSVGNSGGESTRSGVLTRSQTHSSAATKKTKKDFLGEPGLGPGSPKKQKRASFQIGLPLISHDDDRLKAETDIRKSADKEKSSLTSSESASARNYYSARSKSESRKYRGNSMDFAMSKLYRETKWDEEEQKQISTVSSPVQPIITTTSTTTTATFSSTTKNNDAPSPVKKQRAIDYSNTTHSVSSPTSPVTSPRAKAKAAMHSANSLPVPDQSKKRDKDLNKKPLKRKVGDPKQDKLLPVAITTPTTMTTTPSFASVDSASDFSMYSSKSEGFDTITTSVAIQSPLSQSQSRSQIIVKDQLLTIPEEFPPQPHIVGKTFSGGTEEEYKAWMVNRHVYDFWENSLLLYIKHREKEGPNGPNALEVLEALKATLAESIPSIPRGELEALEVKKVEEQSLIKKITEGIPIGKVSSTESGKVKPKRQSEDGKRGKLGILRKKGKKGQPETPPIELTFSQTTGRARIHVHKEEQVKDIVVTYGGVEIIIGKDVNGHVRIVNKGGAHVITSPSLRRQSSVIAEELADLLDAPERTAKLPALVNKSTPFAYSETPPNLSLPANPPSPTSASKTIKQSSLPSPTSMTTSARVGLRRRQTNAPNTQENDNANDQENDPTKPKIKINLSSSAPTLDSTSPTPTDTFEVSERGYQYSNSSSRSNSSYDVKSSDVLEGERKLPTRNMTAEEEDQYDNEADGTTEDSQTSDESYERKQHVYGDDEGDESDASEDKSGSGQRTDDEEEYEQVDPEIYIDDQPTAEEEILLIPQRNRAQPRKVTSDDQLSLSQQRRIHQIKFQQHKPGQPQLGAQRQQIKLESKVSMLQYPELIPDSGDAQGVDDLKNNLEEIQKAIKMLGGNKPLKS